MLLHFLRCAPTSFGSLFFKKKQQQTNSLRAFVPARSLALVCLATAVFRLAGAVQRWLHDCARVERRRILLPESNCQDPSEDRALGGRLVLRRQSPDRHTVRNLFLFLCFSPLARVCLTLLTRCACVASALARMRRRTPAPSAHVPAANGFARALAARPATPCKRRIRTSGRCRST